jgi:hypothetical protein
MLDGAAPASFVHAPVGLRQEIRLDAQDLKDVSVFKPATDPEKFAAHVCVDTQAT